MSEAGTRDARIREELGAWWAEEFPRDVLPTEALIRLSERLAALSPVSRIRATGSIDDGRDRRLPDRQTVTDAFEVPFMKISTPAPSPSAAEEARRSFIQAAKDRQWEACEHSRDVYSVVCMPCAAAVYVAVLAKRDAEIAEYAAHEEQTHRILGGILGTDDSLERCAKRMRERAEAAEARLENMRAVVEAARMVAAHPEHKGGAWIGLLRDQLAALDPQP